MEIFFVPLAFFRQISNLLSMCEFVRDEKEWNKKIIFSVIERDDSIRSRWRAINQCILNSEHEHANTHHKRVLYVLYYEWHENNFLSKQEFWEMTMTF